MQVDPTNIIGEILGEPAAQMRNPVNADYQCPHINSECVKRSQTLTGPYPVCTIWKKEGRGASAESRLMCVCPKRFFEIDFCRDVIENCWPGPRPENPHVAHEIKMADFGNVDLVVADLADDRTVREFVSVELQAIDITGSVFSAYEGVLESKVMEDRPSYGFNMANVYKRFVTQLIAKGFFHHHWGTKIAAVVQDCLYDYIQAKAPFSELGGDDSTSNIIFLVYSFEPDPADSGRQRLVLSRVARTHHSILQSAVLYKTPPSKEEFCRRIEAQLNDG